MIKLVTKLLLNGLAVFVAAKLIPGVQVTSFNTAIIVAVILGIINFLIRPVFIILTLPLNIITLGLFTFIINGIMVIITAQLVQGFYVEGLITAVVFSIIMSIFGAIVNTLSK